MQKQVRDARIVYVEKTINWRVLPMSSGNRQRS